MAGDILKAYMREEQRLEAELMQNPLFIRWRALSTIIDTYPRDYGEAGKASNTKVAKPTPPAKGELGERGPVGPEVVAFYREPKAPKIVAAAVEYLRGVKVRMNSTHLAEALMKRGIELAGQNKASTLSAYLSAAKEINNIRGYGYGLAEWGDSISAPNFEGRDNASSQPH